MRLKTALSLAWSEHGSWAILLTSFGMGTLAAWPPRPATASVFVGLCALTAAKVLYVPARQRRVSAWLVYGLALLGASAFIPLFLSAPLAISAAGLAAAPFAALFAWEADTPKWGRAIPVEAAGVALLSASAGLAMLACHPGAAADAALATGGCAALFMPGVPRARMIKESTAALRLSLLALALCGASFIIALAFWNVVAPFGAAAALAFAGDLRFALIVPKSTARHLGVLLTLRGALAALIMAAAWRTLA